MKEPRKRYEETRLSIILTPDQRRRIEEIREMANVDYADAVATGLALYHDMLKDKKRGSRTIVNHRSGEREEIIV